MRTRGKFSFAIKAIIAFFKPLWRERSNGSRRESNRWEVVQMVWRKGVRRGEELSHLIFNWTSLDSKSLQISSWVTEEDLSLRIRKVQFLSIAEVIFFDTWRWRSTGWGRRWGLSPNKAFPQQTDRQHTERRQTDRGHSMESWVESGGRAEPEILTRLQYREALWTTMLNSLSNGNLL